MIPRQFVDYEDGVTPKTSLTEGDITCYIFKADCSATSVTLSGSNFVHVQNGYWKFKAEETHVDQEGDLTVTFTDPDVFLPVEWTFEVVPVGTKQGIGLAPGRM